ncbi:MAG: N-glycosylase/DNA lyase [Candidatus Micrarchaeota archaeon]|nr:N-glycosylase/DNA lyase [Candidatus Micrarchaeota archaeon]
MSGNEKNFEFLKRYKEKREEIEKRVGEFSKKRQASGRELFEELAFCLLTPQSKALSCHEAVCDLKKSGLLFAGSAKQIERALKGKARFHKKKARYILLARKQFEEDGFEALKRLTFSGSEIEARERLINKIKGLGLKEASHYLRNVGRGSSLAILDRHVMKNLNRWGAIRKIPRSMTRRNYLQIEKKMALFCKRNRIPMAHLDLFFWSEETGFIFK